MKTPTRLLLGAAALLAAGCIVPYEAAVTDVDPRSWSAPAVVQFENIDTASMRDVRIFVRCNARFDADSVPLRIVVLTPDSLRFEEPFTLRIASRKSPAALMRHAETTYRKHTVLDRAGTYRFVITPQYPVRGIEAVGIDILKND